MQEMNLSTSILLWVLNIKTPEYAMKLQNIYCGNVDYEGSDNWGDYLYPVFDSTISNELLVQLRSHSQYVTEFDPGEDNIMFVFKLNDEQKIKIVYPFLDGKYSQIDRDYVNNNFSQYNSAGNLSTNWRILTKDPGLKSIWEQRIGVTFTDEMEAWSRVKKEGEVFGYITAEQLESIPLS